MSKEIKIMNYNVLHGFHQTSPPFALEEKRLEATKKIIKKENPDILVLTEACYGEPNPFNVILDYKKIFNFPYGYFGKWGEHEWGNFLLSKYPIECKTVPFGTRTAIRSKILINNKVVYLDIIHPYPDWTEDEKIADVKPLLKKIKKFYFLVGDFNSVSDEEFYDRKKLIKAFRSFYKNHTEAVDRILERKFIPYLKSVGLKDTFDKNSRSYTIPTGLYGKDKSSAMRIDFIFASPDVESLETKVIKNKLSEYASDHYPIVGRFKI